MQMSHVLFMQISHADLCKLTVDKDRETLLGDHRLMTLVSKTAIKLFGLLIVVSKLEELTRTCHRERRHVAGTNAKEKRWRNYKE